MANFSVLCSKRLALLLSLLLLTAWQISFITAEGPPAPLKPLSGSSKKNHGVVDQAKAFRAIRRPFGNTRIAMFGLGSLAVGGCLYFSHVTMTSSNALKLILQGTSMLLYCYAAAQMFFLGQRFAALHTLFVLVLPIVSTPLMFSVISPLRHFVVQETGTVVANKGPLSSSAVGIMTNQKEDASLQAVASPSRPKGRPSSPLSGAQQTNTAPTTAPSTRAPKIAISTNPHNASRKTPGTGAGASPGGADADRPPTMPTSTATTTTTTTAASTQKALDVDKTASQDASVEAVQKDLPKEITKENVVAAIEAFYAGCAVLEENPGLDGLSALLSKYIKKLDTYITSFVSAKESNDDSLCGKLLEALEKNAYKVKLFDPLSTKGEDHVLLTCRYSLLAKRLQTANNLVEKNAKDLGGLINSMKLILNCIPDDSPSNLRAFSSEVSSDFQKEQVAKAWDFILDCEKEIGTLLRDAVISKMTIEQLTDSLVSLKGIQLEKINGQVRWAIAKVILSLEEALEEHKAADYGAEVVALVTKFPSPRFHVITDATLGNSIDAIYEALGHLSSDKSNLRLKERISSRLDPLKAYINLKCEAVDTGEAVVASLEKLNANTFTKLLLDLAPPEDDIFKEQKEQLLDLKLAQALTSRIPKENPVRDPKKQSLEDLCNLDAVNELLRAVPAKRNLVTMTLVADDPVKKAAKRAFNFIIAEVSSLNSALESFDFNNASKKLLTSIVQNIKDVPSCKFSAFPDHCFALAISKLELEARKKAE